MSNALDRLAVLAVLASTDPFFLGRRLAAYQGARHLTEPQVRESLACTPEQLARLRLCRAPLPGEDLGDYCRQVCDWCGADAGRLADVLAGG